LVCASTNAQKVRANNNSFQTSMSADGRFVAFSSLATNLVSGDHDNVADVFIKDIVTGAVSFGGEGSLPALSADGEKIAMFPRGGGIKLKDLNTQVTTTVADAIDVDGCFSMTPDARFFLFQRNAGHYQMYWKDMASGAEILVSADPGGVPGNDHSYLALPSAPGSLGSCNQSISSDGRYVVFASAADNLVPNDLNGSADIFVKDTLTGAIARVSVNADGTEGIDHSFGAAISSDGRLITFGSFSDNLVPGDTQLCGDTNCPDIFITPNPLLQ
jgi:Tol biopolymer transport system component